MVVMRKLDVHIVCVLRFKVDCYRSACGVVKVLVARGVESVQHGREKSG